MKEKNNNLYIKIKSNNKKEGRRDSNNSNYNRKKYKPQ